VAKKDITPSGIASVLIATESPSFTPISVRALAK